MDELLHFLLTEAPEPAPLDSLEAWWRRHLALALRFASPVDVAFAGGFTADRLGYAFASGYHSAVRALLPGLPREQRYALCATESGGGHPSAMTTRLTAAGRLTGDKTFVTLGSLADVLLVVATEGQDERGQYHARTAHVRDYDRHGVVPPRTR